MPKKICVISQDYDGCYSILTQEGLLAEKKLNKFYWDNLGPKATDEYFASVHKRYHDYLDAISKDASSVHVYVGSARQSARLDSIGNHINGQNGSVFLALEGLCRDKNTKEQPWIFEPLLLADPIIPGDPCNRRQRGEAYKRILLSRSGVKDVVHLDIPKEYISEHKKYSEHIIDTKIPMILGQIWDVYYQNPDVTEIEFYFLDDRLDLINNALKHISGNILPPNVTLICTQFSYLDLDPSAPLPEIGRRTSIKLGADIFSMSQDVVLPVSPYGHRDDFSRADYPYDDSSDDLDDLDDSYSLEELLCSTPGGTVKIVDKDLEPYNLTEKEGIDLLLAFYEGAQQHQAQDTVLKSVPTMARQEEKQPPLAAGRGEKHLRFSPTSAFFGQETPKRKRLCDSHLSEEKQQGAIVGYSAG